ncbi:MAG: hypothetical protein R3F14_17600 [Polyangiaceae bacterium]
MTLAVVSLRRARAARAARAARTARTAARAARTAARALSATGAASLVALLAFASPAPAAAQTAPQSEFRNRRVELTADVGAFLVPGRFAVENGLTFGLDAAFRVPSSGRVRFQVGAGFRGASTYDATHLGLRVPLGIGIGVGRFAEIYIGATAGYTRILFDSPYFAGVNAFAGSLEAGLRFTVSSRVAIGIHPFVFGLYASPDIDTLPTYEPKLLTLSVAVP